VPPYNPGTRLEAVFLVLANVFAFYVCALFVGSMVAMLDALYKTKQKLKADQALLEGFMVKRKIPSLLQAQALEDLVQSHEQEDDDSYEQVLDRLAPPIRQAIREELYVTVVQRHPFFAPIAADALRHLCGQVHVLHTHRGDYIVRRGQVASSMFFIVEGHLLAQRNVEDVAGEDVHLTNQAFFGAVCLFKESTRTRNVIALTNTELIEVTTSTVYAWGEDYPEVGAALKERVKEAAAAKDLCAHCGYAHKISECPLLGRTPAAGKAAQEETTQSPSLSGTKKRTFKAAATAVMFGKRVQRAKSMQATPFRRSLTTRDPTFAPDRSHTRSTTTKAIDVLAGRAKEEEDAAENFSKTAVMPGMQPAAEKLRSSLLRRASSASSLTSEDEECLSPYSPLIKVEVRHAAEAR
jgi:hypothetical protein